MKTIEFSANITVLKPVIFESAVKNTFTEVWQHFSEKEFNNSKIHISAVVNESKLTMQPNSVLFTVEGFYDPRCCNNREMEAWKLAVKRVVQAVMEFYNQEAATLLFREVELQYLKINKQI